MRQDVVVAVLQYAISVGMLILNLKRLFAMVTCISVGAEDHLLIIVTTIDVLDVLLAYGKVLVVLFQLVHTKHVFVE